MNTITLPQLAWHGTKKLELPLPDSWQVELYNMAGYDRPAIKPDEIKASLGMLCCGLFKSSIGLRLRWRYIPMLISNGLKGRR